MKLSPRIYVFVYCVSLVTGSAGYFVGVWVTKRTHSPGSWLTWVCSLVGMILGNLVCLFLLARSFGRRAHETTRLGIPGETMRTAIPVRSITEEYAYINHRIGSRCPLCQRMGKTAIPLSVEGHGLAPRSKLRLRLGMLIGPDVGMLYDYITLKCEDDTNPHYMKVYFDVRAIEYFAQHGFTVQTSLTHMQKVSEFGERGGIRWSGGH